MAQIEQEQIVADLLAEERIAVETARALSARRAALAQEALGFDQALGAVVEAGNAAIDESLHHLLGVVDQHRALTADALVEWGEVEPVVLAGIALIGAFREAVAPVIEAMARNVRHLAPLLGVVDAEIEARAAALLAARNAALATEATRHPLQ